MYQQICTDMRSHLLSGKVLQAFRLRFVVVLIKHAPSIYSDMKQVCYVFLCAHDIR